MHSTDTDVLQTGSKSVFSTENACRNTLSIKKQIVVIIILVVIIFQVGVLWVMEYRGSLSSHKLPTIKSEKVLQGLFPSYLENIGCPPGT